jgi:hypothetical protein
MGYAGAMRFSPEDLAVLEATLEVGIETVSGDGHVHRTVVWVVQDDGEVFVRSVRGPAGRWYREALDRPSVGLHIDGRRLTARVVPAPDPAEVERASAAFARKYAGDPDLPSILREEVLDTTLRLDPA